MCWRKAESIQWFLLSFRYLSWSWLANRTAGLSWNGFTIGINSFSWRTKVFIVQFFLSYSEGLSINGVDFGNKTRGWLCDTNVVFAFYAWKFVTTSITRLRCTLQAQNSKFIKREKLGLQNVFKKNRQHYGLNMTKTGDWVGEGKTGGVTLKVLILYIYD